VIYALGFLIILSTRVVYAGMRTQELFYVEKETYDHSYTKKTVQTALDGDLVLKYCTVTFVASFLWPIALPAYGLFKLGQRFAK
jgi:hypothetical protein